MMRCLRGELTGGKSSMDVHMQYEMPGGRAAIAKTIVNLKYWTVLEYRSRCRRD